DRAGERRRPPRPRSPSGAQARLRRGLDLLRRAHELRPDNARYAYVYAVALNSTGAHAEAMALLEQTHRRHPADRDVLLALVSIARDSGDVSRALLYARELVALHPADPQLRSLLLELERGKAH